MLLYNRWRLFLIKHNTTKKTQFAQFFWVPFLVARNWSDAANHWQNWFSFVFVVLSFFCWFGKRFGGISSDDESGTHNPRGIDTSSKAYSYMAEWHQSRSAGDAWSRPITWTQRHEDEVMVWGDSRVLTARSHHRSSKIERAFCPDRDWVMSILLLRDEREKKRQSRCLANNNQM